MMTLLEEHTPKILKMFCNTGEHAKAVTSSFARLDVESTAIQLLDEIYNLSSWNVLWNAMNSRMLSYISLLRI